MSSSTLCLICCGHDTTSGGNGGKRCGGQTLESRRWWCRSRIIAAAHGIVLFCVCFQSYVINFRFFCSGDVLVASGFPSDLKRGNFQSPVNAMGLRPVISVRPISSHFGIAGRGTGLSGLCLTFCCGGLNLPRCTGSTRICRACTFVATHTLTGDGACCACVLSPKASLQPMVYFSQRMIE